MDGLLGNILGTVKTDNQISLDQKSVLNTGIILGLSAIVAAVLIKFIYKLLGW
ncbi:hypothetical protein SAMN04515674_101517 [Pseudarcicella hirudinis]|uniref:Uncharacterized protein n=1 Tax=Pseudarcicella hirudinis TaxID=1079859 RepID=A0A1I5MYU7_9BACT|nr:hypothetical protein [Pseudarcicella hirudinis]SFP14734.1 hypothetical protein SAMN04515674_101517 [Pseudarcicella hirudinis]